MTVYTEDTIPAAETVVVVWFLGLPIPLSSSGYTEDQVQATAHVECEVPTTVSTECEIPVVAYTEDLI